MSPDSRAGSVGRSLRCLSVRPWVFVSPGNVYADHSTPGGESGELLHFLQGEVMASMETNGQTKIACTLLFPERLSAPATSPAHRTGGFRTGRVAAGPAGRALDGRPFNRSG